MANKKISQFDQFPVTASTDGGWMLFNDSGETTTYKIEKDQLFYLNSTHQGYVAQGTGATYNVALIPKGSGAFVMDTSGNTRGLYALDLSRLRDTPDRVASGNYSIALGWNPKASGTNSVAIGNGATATNNNSVAFPSASASGSNAFAGPSNTASGTPSTAFGEGSTATGSFSYVQGRYCNATGNYSVLLGGDSNTVSGFASLGYYATIPNTYNIAFGVGSGLAHDFMFSKENQVLASGATYVMTRPASATTSWTMSDNRKYYLDIKWMAKCVTSGGGGSDPSVEDTIMQRFVCAYKKVGSTLTQLGADVVKDTFSDASMSGATMVSANVSNNLGFTFTAPPTTNNNTYSIAIHVTMHEIYF